MSSSLPDGYVKMSWSEDTDPLVKESPKWTEAEIYRLMMNPHLAFVMMAWTSPILPNDGFYDIADAFLQTRLDLENTRLELAEALRQKDGSTVKTE